MPSIRALITGIALATLLFLSSADSQPANSKYSPTTTKPAGQPKATPLPPLNGGASELPGPTLTLMYVSVGRGVQNYTCTGPGALPVAIGAVATLYDATRLAFTSDEILHKIPPKAVYLPLPSSKLSLALLEKSLKILGHHYFDAAGTPVFDLSTPSAKTILFAARNSSVKAPISADKGPAGTGAVDWLFLTDKGGYYPSVGLSQAYRVVTAGGVGPTCSRSGIEAVEYATEYWFYK